MFVKSRAARSNNRKRLSLIKIETKKKHSSCWIPHSSGCQYRRTPLSCHAESEKQYHASKRQRVQSKREKVSAKRVSCTEEEKNIKRKKRSLSRYYGEEKEDSWRIEFLGDEDTHQGDEDGGEDGLIRQHDGL
jgi:hypothetical protein